MSNSFAHLDLASLSHFSWQILSSSVRLDGKHLWTAIFRCLPWCSMGHSRTIRELSTSSSSGVLVVCFWPFIMRWTVATVSGYVHSWEGFLQETLCIWLYSYLPQLWSVFLSLCFRLTSVAWCCHHHALPLVFARHRQLLLFNFTIIIASELQGTPKAFGLLLVTKYFYNEVLVFLLR